MFVIFSDEGVRHAGVQHGFTMVELIVVGRPGLPYNSIREIVAVAKASPGKISYATAGSGSPPHLSFEYLNSLAVIELLHVPYKGEAAALTDLIGEQIQMVPANFAAALPQIQGGRVRCWGQRAWRHVTEIHASPRSCMPVCGCCGLLQRKAYRGFARCEKARKPHRHRGDSLLINSQR